MSLFPHFIPEPAAAAKPAKVDIQPKDGVPRFSNISNFSNFSSPSPAEAPAHDLALRIADLADAWRERVAICLEAGDITEAEARLIADAEIGRRFVEIFMERGAS